MYTLTIILNEQMDEVLMCSHQKHQAFNFIGGKVEDCEDCMEASYRELFEETGIKKEDVKLHFLQQESTTLWNGDIWNMYITVGVLNKEVKLVEEKNPLVWIRDWDFLKQCWLDGSCFVYFNRAIKFLVENKITGSD